MGMGLCTSRTTAVKMVGTGMTREKLQKMAELSRVGGVRRTHKAVRKGAATGEDAKLAAGLKKMGVSLIMDNGTVVQFENPKVQASIQSNTYVVSGNSRTMNMSDILSQVAQAEGSQ